MAQLKAEIEQLNSGSRKALYQCSSRGSLICSSWAHSDMSTASFDISFRLLRRISIGKERSRDVCACWLLLQVSAVWINESDGTQVKISLSVVALL
jgi:hypothetical protein